MTTDLVRHDGGNALSVADVLTVAQHLAKSGYFKDATDVSKAVAKILYGQALGIAPVQAMMGIDIIEGKPAPSAGLTAALVRRAGRYDYRVVDPEADPVVIEWSRDGEAIGRSSFGTDDAKRAGLAGKTNYQRWPKAMRFSRALTAGARMYCPDVFLGPVYTAEELTNGGATVDGETGEVIDAQRPPAAVILDYPGPTATSAPATGPQPLPADLLPDPPAEAPSGDPEPSGEDSWRATIDACDDPTRLLGYLVAIDAEPDVFRRAGALRLWRDRLVDIGSPADLTTAGKAIRQWPADTASRTELLDSLRAALADLKARVEVAP